MDKEVRKIEFNVGNNNSGEYKVEVIWDSTVYAKKLKSGLLSGFYYLVLWKRYLNEKNTWEPSSAVQLLRKFISLFHKDHLDKPTAIFLTIDTVSPMARLIIKLTELFK